MARFTIQSAGMVFSNSPAPAGGRGGPNPATSPITLTVPGTYRRSGPPGVTAVDVALYGGGAGGGGGTGGAGGHGAGGGGYMLLHLAAPLYHPGDVLTIVVGAGGAGGAPGAGAVAGHNTSLSVNGLEVARANGSAGNFGGFPVFTPQDGLTVTDSHSGGNGLAAVGTTGGEGGLNGSITGAGAPGGGPGVAGTAGAGFGNGGGGGGSGAGGGAGSPGRAVMSW